MVAVGGDALVAFLCRSFEAHHDGFLPDVEMAETADEAHAVELARLLFESAYEQHVAIVGEQLVLRSI